MGLIIGSGSFTRYLAEGDLPEDFLGELQEKTAKHSFRNLEEKSISERSIGWVNVMDMFDNHFSGLDFLKEPYITMSFRVDEKKIPPSALKQYSLEAEDRIKKEENLEYLSRTRRLDIKEGVRLHLLQRAIPVSKVYDMVWNYTTGHVLFGCTMNKICDDFVELFLRTFDIQLQALYPYALATRFFDKKGALRDALEGLGPSDFSQEK
ncbi:MAG: recombination-associated protein RdgC [Desulfatiglans sp.]|jgi:DNA recombination-dependent growth factor C|nr:recombination-associated protein RdgC [Thermodesulfobacteriota bacterium]MEE4352983.1 recombination-associated protein RdgC [Desulfatiglans sp.]